MLMGDTNVLQIDCFIGLFKLRFDLQDSNEIRAALEQTTEFEVTSNILAGKINYTHPVIFILYSSDWFMYFILWLPVMILNLTSILSANALMTSTSYKCYQNIRLTYIFITLITCWWKVALRCFYSKLIGYKENMTCFVNIRFKTIYKYIKQYIRIFNFIKYRSQLKH